MTGDRHACPWPGCSRMVLPWFWGCAPHWMMLPRELRDPFLSTRERDAQTQPVAHQMAIERIRNWLTDNARADVLQQSTATPDLGAEFSAGYASDGHVFLFWPLAGEYLVLRALEVRTLQRLLARERPA